MPRIWDLTNLRCRVCGAHRHAHRLRGDGLLQESVSLSLSYSLFLVDLLSRYHHRSLSLLPCSLSRSVSICTYILCVYIYTYIHTYMHTYIHTYTHVILLVSPRLLRSIWPCPFYLNTQTMYIHASIHTCIHTYLHTYVRTYIQQAVIQLRMPAGFAELRVKWIPVY